MKKQKYFLGIIGCGRRNLLRLIKDKKGLFNEILSELNEVLKEDCRMIDNKNVSESYKNITKYLQYNIDELVKES